MARSINQVNLMGRLTREPEQRATTSGKIITNFSIAVDRQGDADNTDFFDITAWNKLAEIVTQYTHKGSKVYVSGRLQLDRWDDKNDGSKKSKISIVANDVVFLDSAQTDQSQDERFNGSQFETLEKAGVIEKKDTQSKGFDLNEIPF